MRTRKYEENEKPIACFYFKFNMAQPLKALTFHKCSWKRLKWAWGKWHTRVTRVITRKSLGKTHQSEGCTKYTGPPKSMNLTEQKEEDEKNALGPTELTLWIRQYPNSRRARRKPNQGALILTPRTSLGILKATCDCFQKVVRSPINSVPPNQSEKVENLLTNAINGY